MKRMIIIQIEDEDKNKVDRFADLITDELGLIVNFAKAANDCFAVEAARPNPLPTISVQQHDLGSRQKM